MDWLWVKDLISHLGVAKDALHIYFAVLIQILAAAGLRRPLSNWMPWAVVLLAAMLNEVMDLQFEDEPQVQEWQRVGARHDILNTMILPSVLLILCRFAPQLFTTRLIKENVPARDAEEKLEQNYLHPESNTRS
jgi:hypothetical protein